MPRQLWRDSARRHPAQRCEVSLPLPWCACVSCVTQLLCTCLHSAGLGLQRQSSRPPWSPAMPRSGSLPSSRPVRPACGTGNSQAHVADTLLLSAPVHLALMLMCCRPCRRTAAFPTAPVSPACSIRYGDHPCPHCQVCWAGHLGSFSARRQPRPSPPLARWVCHACTVSSASSACKGSLFSLKISAAICLTGA